MSNFSQLPQVVSLPTEFEVNNINPCVPPETKSSSIRVYAVNNPTVTSSFSTGTPTTATVIPEIPFPQTEINFDIPVAQSRDTWIDTRMSTISFRCVVTTTTAGNIKVTSGTLRSSAYSFFDNMRVTGQSGNLLENINEYGLVADTLIQGQLSNSDREGLFNYGFKSTFGETTSTTAGANNAFTNSGHDLPVLSKAGALVLNDSVSHNYSIPLLSSTLGVLADRFFPSGLTKKLMVTLTTASVLPFSIVTADTTTPTASTVKVELTDFFLNLETIKIGDNAMNHILSNLKDGKMFLHGSTYKTTTSLIPANATGSINLPIGITGTSVRSLFTRFYETATNPVWGKYSSANPCLNQFGYNIGGLQVPSSLYNPSLYPALSWRSFLMAMGTFNSTQFKSGITALSYGRLASGGTATTVTSGQSSTQDAIFKSITTNALYQSTFLLGENLETIPRRGLLSGRDLTFQKVGLILGIATASTNSINVYVTALMDTICIVDVNSGDCQSIL